MKIPSLKKLDMGFVFTFLASIIFFAVHFNSSVYRYNTLQYKDWDLAILSNGMWNLVHGNAYISIIDKPLLGNHFNVIAYLIAPVFLVFKHPLTLLFLQTLALTLPALPIYSLGKRFFNDNTGFLLALVYFLYPPVFYAARYEFHFETLAPLFLTLTLYFVYTGRNFWVIISGITAMLCKENIPLTVMGIGLYTIFFVPRKKILGFLVTLMGAGYFLLVTLKLQPLFNPSIGYAAHYAKYGAGFSDVYAHVLTHPGEIIREIFSSRQNLNFFYEILSPLLFLPLLAPDVLLITAP
ncbi:MAG: DUF2079 domain-containing protein, partial [Candidatus Omnitrophica bacterium]|nr:DUF2079 domain-containing protein [Candidatus Omnitrophota bacterium]